MMMVVEVGLLLHVELYIKHKIGNNRVVVLVLLVILDLLEKLHKYCATAVCYSSFAEWQGVNRYYGVVINKCAQLN